MARKSGQLVYRAFALAPYEILEIEFILVLPEPRAIISSFYK